MIRISKIEITGISARGPFGGSFEFGPGLQVVSTPNRRGKSLAFAGTTWCLGVEQIYGVLASDNSIFPDAARSRVDLGNERAVPVSTADAHLELERDDGAQLSLSRSIVGGELNRIAYDDGVTKGVLQVGYGASKDTTAGFQAHFRKWADLPEFRLMSSHGGEYPIYLENLAPLFLIEQLRGWTSIQAEQVYRYGLLEVADGAFEYLLGLDDHLKNRLARQRSVSQEQALHEEARFIAEEFRKVLSDEGWTGELTTRGPVRSIADKWAQIDFHGYVKERFTFDYDREQRRLRERIDALRVQLASPEKVPAGTASTDASQTAIQLKTQRHDLQARLRTIRSQLKEQQSVLASVEGRWSSARDLLRLKTEGIGVLPAAECPTCHQVVDTERLHLHEQPKATIEVHVDTLERQRNMLRRNVELLEREVVAAAAEAQRLDTELQQAERALRFVNEANGSARESAVKLATDILGAEREMEKNRSVHERIEALQEQARSWIRRATELPVMEAIVPDEELHRTAFETALRDYVVSLGVGGVKEAEAQTLHLGDAYEPLLGDRGLPAFGSASDRARLVMAYVLALLATGRRHPGFVVLDEPVQQNPDPHHRNRWVQFLCDRATSFERQAILFTSLTSEEVGQLRHAGISVQEREALLLNPVGPE